MNLGVSSLAWSPEDSSRIGVVLQKLGVGHIDVVPGKLRREPGSVQEVRRRWSEFGIAILGMQSLYFEHPALNLFGPPAMREAMLDHLRQVAAMASGLGATRLVFGSPRNRRRQAQSPEEAEALAVEFFRSAGAIAADHGAVLTVEAAPMPDGFAVTTAEAAAWVQTIDHPGVRLQLDLGILMLEGQSIDAAVTRFAPLVGHIHISEPGLIEVGLGGADHVTFAAAVRRELPALAGTLEMLVPEGHDAVASVQRAVRFAASRYATQ